MTARDQTFELPIAVDRRLGRRARDASPATGRVPRDARPRGAFERLPDDARARDPDALLGTIDRARRLPPQGAVPARTSPPNCRAVQRARRRSSRTRRSTRRRSASRRARTSCAIDDDGAPMRIDKAFSWEYPLSAHGLMHNVITNAWRGDPYRIDTLMIFMANMAWNSTMNTDRGARDAERQATPTASTRSRSSSCATRSSRETAAFADLVLPDTTYLERHDVMRMLDRPISEFDGPCDSVRVPVVPPTGECRPFQEVLVELASRLKLPGLHRRRRRAQVQATTPTSSSTSRPSPARASASCRAGAARTATSACAASRIRSSGRCTRRTTASSTTSCRASMQYMRNWNRGYLDFAQRHGLRRDERPDPDRSSIPTRCRRFRLAAQGKTAGRQPPEHLRERIETYFDPLPFWYPPLEDAGDRPRRAIRSPRSRSGRWRCTTRGIRRTRGCGRSTATTTCT